MTDLRSINALWRPVAISGIVLTPVSIVAGCIDEASSFHFEFISDRFEYFLTASTIGYVLLFVGLVGWARLLKRKDRMPIFIGVCASPWIAFLLSYPLDKGNFHYVGGLILLLVPLLTLLALVLLATPEKPLPDGGR